MRTNRWFRNAPTERLKYILGSRSKKTNKKKSELITDIAKLILTDSELATLGIPEKEYRRITKMNNRERKENIDRLKKLDLDQINETEDRHYQLYKLAKQVRKAMEEGII